MRHHVLTVVFLLLLSGLGLPASADATPRGLPAFSPDDPDTPHQQARMDTVTLSVEMVGGPFDSAHTLTDGFDGDLLVSDANAGRIKRYRIPAGYRQSGHECPGAGPEIGVDRGASAGLVETIELSIFDRPEAMANAAETFLAVVGSAERQVHLLDETMAYVRSLAVPAWAAGEAPFTPEDVTSNTIGELFVLDADNKRIYHFNANGSFLQYFPIDGLDRPSALMYADESLFIADKGGGRVHVITDGGHELAVIGTFPHLGRVRVIDRNIWVLSGGVIHRFNMSGEHLGNWAPDIAGKPLRDLAVIGGNLFLLTSGSLYFSGSIETP
ncbi:hypothetical protein QA596_06835 [Balneolales bacterium ANBcel1]|nr:hypothetical protein [Balneolales bacterium ANBcel1]